jgi:hypothetical protein
MVRPDMQGSWRLFPLVALALVAACGDARLAELTPGIDRDSLLRILAPDGATSDTLPHIVRRETYLSKGQMLEVLFYSGRDAGAEVEEGALTPIVLRSDTVMGWGWAHFDSVAAEHNIQARPR